MAARVAIRASSRTTGSWISVTQSAGSLTSRGTRTPGSSPEAPRRPIAEEVAGRWLMELLGIPPTASFAFVTGCQLAHVTCLAAARHAVLERAVWDVESRGLAGAPPIRVVVGGKRHVTIDRALRLLGLGRESVVAASVDKQGRTSAIAVEAALRGHDSPAIVCAQVGEVNTGSIDPVAEIASRIRGSGAWLHVD